MKHFYSVKRIMKYKILQKLFIIVLSIFALSANVIADEVDVERKIRLLEIREKMGDKRAFWELRKLRRTVKPKPNSRANQQIRSNPRPQSQQKQKTLQVPRRNPKTTSGHISNYITVEASGVGADYDSALRDAFKDAVRKVVGVYVITQTKTTSSSNGKDMFDEKIYLNADAVVTKYDVLQKTEIDGVTTIKINATVVKNDLLKYVKKEVNTDISNINIVNVLNKIDMLKEAEQSLDYILKDYVCKVITIRPFGEITIGSYEDVPEGYINFQVGYKIEFNDSAFKNITSRLQTFLDKVALGKGIGYMGDGENIYSCTYDFCKKYQSDTRFIVFIDRKKTVQKQIHCQRRFRQSASSNRKLETRRQVGYKIYAVHQKIYTKISSLTEKPRGIAFHFFLKNQTQPIIKIIERSDPYNLSLTDDDYRHTGVLFRDHIYYYYSRIIDLKGQFKEGFFMRIEDFKNLTQCTIKAIPVSVRNLNSVAEERVIEVFGKSLPKGRLIRENVDHTIDKYRLFNGNYNIFSF